MAFFSSTIRAVLAAGLLAAVVFGVAEGQANDCATKLMACSSTNSSNPSPECCTAMKQVMETQLDCLCGMVNNPSLPGIDMKKALEEVPKHCNISSKPNPCPGGAQAGSGSGSSGESSGDGGKTGNAVRVSSWIGMPAAALLCILAVTFLY